MQRLRAQQVETELKQLKSQVNQHFLFNTFTNLYGLSLAQPSQIPQALLQLADLMCYQLDSGQAQPITVGSEADYLTNYVGLEKLRLWDGSLVEWTPQLLDPMRPLAPLLLLPLVENCFKHAVGPGSLPVIRVWLTQTPTTLTLRTENSVPPQFRPAPSGLGLPTLRVRLARYYPGARHELVLTAEPGYYRAHLTLVL
jgi:sensor histidine kinase YesM